MAVHRRKFRAARLGFGQHRLAHCPQPLGTVRIACPTPHMLPALAVFIAHGRNIAVFAIDPAHAVKLRRGRSPDCC